MTIFSNFENTNQETSVILPKNGRLLGIDIGTKRLGIAVSDESRLIATPKLIINRQSNLKDFAKIKEIIDEYKIVGIVAGMPINLDDSEIPMTIFANNFCQNLDEFLDKKLPIFFCDERLTSFEAREIGASKLSRKKNKSGKKYIDDIAASLILRGFMDIYDINKPI
ncbi:MAG: Holliday junction resolvase RuvX [Rickettsiales bacterium]|nr:Holliday junction resolvase RuvX [Rickettsiales bacterium]